MEVQWSQCSRAGAVEQWSQWCNERGSSGSTVDHKSPLTANSLPHYHQPLLKVTVHSLGKLARTATAQSSPTIEMADKFQNSPSLYLHYRHSFGERNPHPFPPIPTPPILAKFQFFPLRFSNTFKLRSLLYPKLNMPIATPAHQIQFFAHNITHNIPKHDCEPLERPHIGFGVGITVTTPHVTATTVTIVITTTVDTSHHCHH